MTESELAQHALVKVGEFIKMTGDELIDVKEACKQLILAVQEMNKTLRDIKSAGNKSARSEWISIESGLPENWGMYLLRYIRTNPHGGYTIDHQVIHFDNQRKKFNVEYTDDEPTHWALLPEAP